MRFSVILLIVAVVASICGCRHTYEPAPAPYYCQPAGCGCAPAPVCNPCAPGGTQYYAPQSGAGQPRLAPTTTYTTPGTTINTPPPGGAYSGGASGAYPAPNPNSNVGPR